MRVSIPFCLAASAPFWCWNTYIRYKLTNMIVIAMTTIATSQLATRFPRKQERTEYTGRPFITPRGLASRPEKLLLKIISPFQRLRLTIYFWDVLELVHTVQTVPDARRRQIRSKVVH